MYEMLKLEGRIQRLEIYDDSLSAFGKSGDAQITRNRPHALQDRGCRRVPGFRL